MKNCLSEKHKQQFEDIKNNLAILGAKESHFIKVELLFFEAITIARTYGNDVAGNPLLAALKQLQANQYQETKALFRKSVQRERVIRRFISSLKSTLTAAAKISFPEPQLT